MFWKKYVFYYLLVILTFVLSLITVLYVIDPMNIWGSVLIRGINHYKIKENLFFDISKAYQYEKIKPDEVVIGSSRVYVGINPLRTKNLYNFG